MMEVLFAVAIASVVPLWLRIRELEWQLKNHEDYFSWWLRSMEERKEDKESVKRMDDSLLEEE